MAALGRHVTADCTVTRTKWPNSGVLRELLLTAANSGGATPLESHVFQLPCDQSRPSSPPGGTAYVVLDESHIALHWYTKKDTVDFALDVFTCGEHADPHSIAMDFMGLLTCDVLSATWNFYERFTVDR